MDPVQIIANIYIHFILLRSDYVDLWKQFLYQGLTYSIRGATLKQNLQLQNPTGTGKDEFENDPDPDSQSTQCQNHLKYITATDNLIRFIQREQEQQTSACTVKAKYRSEVMMSELKLFQELFIRVHNGPNHM